MKTPWMVQSINLLTFSFHTTKTTYFNIWWSFSPFLLPPPGVWGFGVWGQGRSPWPQRGPRGAPLFIKLDESLDFRLESKMKFVVATNQILKFHKTKTEPLQMLLAALHSFPWILWVVEISKIGQTSELWFVSNFGWVLIRVVKKG